MRSCRRHPCCSNTRARGRHHTARRDLLTRARASRHAILSSAGARCGGAPAPIHHVSAVRFSLESQAAQTERPLSKRRSRGHAGTRRAVPQAQSIGHVNGLFHRPRSQAGGASCKRSLSTGRSCTKRPSENDAVIDGKVGFYLTIKQCLLSQNPGVTHHVSFRVPQSIPKTICWHIDCGTACGTNF
jgi:hypothetical protein